MLCNKSGIMRVFGRRMASGGIPKPPVTASVALGAKSGPKKTSGSPFDSSFSFQMFLIVGAMGAGYTLGKTSITNDPPPTLFPKGSVTTLDDLKDFKDDLNYDRFKRCILRVLESKQIAVDVKHGKNEALYQETFCNEEIAKVMNDIDGMGDVFFGKNQDVWQGKHFTWFPETTKDVSMILQLATEFCVPVYTILGDKDTSGLAFELDMTKLNNDSPLDVRLSSLDLFLSTCGLPLMGKTINGATLESIKQITAVLADGTIVEAKKDAANGEGELFTLLTTLQNELCVITNVKTETPSDLNDSKLVIIGTNSTEKLNETITDVSKRLNNTNIAVVDSHNPHTKLYGDFSSFAIFKATPTELGSLNKKYTNGETASSHTIVSLPLNQLKAAAKNVSGIDGILATEDVVNKSFQTLNFTTEKAHDDKLALAQSVLRRLKLSMDTKLVLNRDLTIKVE